MKNCAELIRIFQELQNDSNPLHFEAAIAHFVAQKESLALSEDLRQLEVILEKFKKKDLASKHKALAVIKAVIDIEIETDYTLFFS